MTFFVSSLLQQVIQVVHYVTSCSGPYHEPVYNSPVSVKARVEYQVSRSTSDNGLTPYALIYVPLEVFPEDKVVLPDGTIRKVISVKREHDENGVFSHSEVVV